MHRLSLRQEFQASIHKNKILIGVALLTVVLYLPSLFFPFVFDDNPQILGNYKIQSWTQAPGYFTDHVWAQKVGQSQANYYRPFFLLWLLINYTLFEMNPVGWHLTTILVHLAATVLAYKVAHRLLGDDREAGLAALIFGIHPAQIESVAWISGVPEPLAALFIFGAFLAYLRSKQEGMGAKWRWTSFALYFSALLCKETAVIFPATVFLYAICLEARSDPFWRRTRLASAQALAYAPVLGLYFLVRTLALGGMYRAQATADLPTMLLTLPAMLWGYAKILLFPFRLAVYYDVQFVRAADKAFWLPLAAILAVVGLTFWLVRRSREQIFAVAWIVTFLAIPVASGRFFHQGIGLVHDRYVYLSLLGFALLVVYILREIAKPEALFARRRLALASVAVIVGVYGFGVVTQEAHWRSTRAIFERALELYPDRSGPLKVTVAEQLMEEGKREEAGRLFAEAYREEENWFSMFGMAKWYYEEGKFREAEGLLERCIPLFPARYTQYYMLGMTRIGMGRFEEALAPLGKSVVMAPENMENRIQYARALHSAGRTHEAIVQYKIVLEQHPKEEQLREYIRVLEAQLAKQKAGPSN